MAAVHQGRHLNACCTLVALGAVINKCKANNAKVFADAVSRTAAIEAKSNTELAEYNVNLKKLQDDYNEHLRELHQRNLALVRKHCPEDVAEGSV